MSNRVRRTFAATRTVLKCSALLLLVASIRFAFAQSAPDASPIPVQRANELHEAAIAFESSGQWESAVETRRQILQLFEATSGADGRHTDIARADLANLLEKLGRYGEARELLQLSLKVQVKMLPPDAIDIPATLNQLGELCRQEGMLSNSLSYYSQCKERLLGRTNTVPLLAAVMHNEASAWLSLGDTSRAEKLELEALRVLAMLPEANLAMRVPPLSNLGDIHRSQGLLTRALQEQLQAAALLTNIPPAHPIQAVVANNLASLYRDLGQTAASIQICSNALTTLAATRGANALDVLKFRLNLAQALGANGDFRPARLMLEELRQRMETGGLTNQTLYFSVLAALGAQQQNCGDLESAERSYQPALSIAKGRFGPDHALTCEIQERLASLWLLRLDQARARELLEQSLAARKRAAERNPNLRLGVATGLFEWAKLVKATGRTDLAADSLQQALSIQMEMLPTNHPALAETYEQQALLAGEAGQLAEALQLHKAAAGILEQSSGNRSLHMAQCQMNIADILARQGNFRSAIDIATPAVKVFGDVLGTNHLWTCMAAFQLATIRHFSGELTNAAPLYAMALAEFDRLGVRYSVVAARDAGLLESDLGHGAAAVAMAARAREVQDRLWEEQLRFGSEVDRLAVGSHAALMTLLAEVAPIDPLPIASAVLRWKGAVMDSLVEDRQLAGQGIGPAIADDVAALKSARLRRYELSLAVTGESSAKAEARREAAAQVEELESRMAHRFSSINEHRRAAGITPEQLRTNLPADVVLVEYVRYERWRGAGRTEPCFGAVVFSGHGPPAWLSLGSAEGKEGIAVMVRNFQLAVRGKATNAQTELIATASKLHDRLWLPLAPWLTNGVKRVIIAPDGEISFVPFAVLWTGKHFLTAKYDINYVTSGRDLLAPALLPPAVRTVDLYGNPRFARSGWQQTLDAWWVRTKDLWRTPVMNGCSPTNFTMVLKPLPETASEVEAVAKIVGSNGGKPSVFLTGDATESLLRQRPSPNVLHLATHGVFIDDVTMPDLSAFQFSKAPAFVAQSAMWRAWVALAGANETLEAWRKDQPPPTANDGLLTAEEIATLELTNTWLVALSACDTGVGIARTGEGVFGLRRAFALAGAQNLLVTLWPINDLHGREFMEAFYADALSSSNAPAALARTQRAKLAQWEASDGPFNAVRWAGPYVLNLRGGLPR